MLSSVAWNRLRFDERQSVATLDNITMYHNRWLFDDSPALVGNRARGAVYRLHLPVVASQVFPLERRSVVTFASEATLLRRDDVYKRLSI